jgi:hypothetical protein
MPGTRGTGLSADASDPRSYRCDLPLPGQRMMPVVVAGRGVAAGPPCVPAFAFGHGLLAGGGDRGRVM